MSRIYSKELLLTPDLLYSFDKADNCLLFISYYGKFKFFMYHKNCFLIKKGQRLKLVYRLDELNFDKSKHIKIVKSNISSLCVFFRQLISRLNYPSFSSLSLIGMGYRANIISRNLELNLGFSHKMLVDCPNGIRIFVRKSQRQHTISFFSSTLFDSKNLASKIVKYRPVSPYTGKGIVWFGSEILRKEGKGQFKR